MHVRWSWTEFCGGQKWIKLLLVFWLNLAALQAGVKMIEGRGKIVDPHTVSVQGKKYTVCPHHLLCCTCIWC